MDLIICEDFLLPYIIKGLIYFGLTVLQMARERRIFFKVDTTYRTPKDCKVLDDCKYITKKTAEFAFSF